MFVHAHSRTCTFTHADPLMRRTQSDRMGINKDRQATINIRGQSPSIIRLGESLI